MSPSLTHLWDHRVVLYRVQTVKDAFGDTIEGWVAQTSPSGKNARPDQTWMGDQIERGPGEQQAGRRPWLLDKAFSDVRERDVLSVTDGPEAGSKVRILSVTRPTHPRLHQVHHFEVNTEIFQGELTPPASVATTVTLTPSSFSVDEEDTVELTVEVRDQFGAVMTGWSGSVMSSNEAVATAVILDDVVTVTGVNPGSVTITATVSGISDDSAGTVVAVDLHLALIEALGGDGVVLGFYVTTNGETGAADDSVIVNAGVVDEWWDYRGETGFGPKLVGTGTARPAWDAANTEIEFDGVDDYLITAVSSVFDLSTAKTLVYVGDSKSGDGCMVSITDPTIIARAMLLYGQSGNIKAQFQNPQENIDSTVAVGTTRHVMFAAKNASTTGFVEVPNVAQATSAITAKGAGDNRMIVAKYDDDSGGAYAVVVKAVMVLDGAYTVGQKTLIRDAAIATLGAVAA